MQGRAPVFAIVLWIVVTPIPALAADWPQWRGANRDSTWRESAVQDRFPAQDLSARWRRPIGGGFGGIAVRDGKVYVMDRATQPREVERVLCLNAATGKQVWVHSYPVRYGKLDYGNGPRATPTVHDGRLYAFGALGHLHCLDAATGAVLWSKDTVAEYKGRPLMWGRACSPLIDGDRLVLQVGGEPDACFVALDRINGKELWRSLADRPGYSSPVVIAGNGFRQLVCWSAEHVAGLEPATGAVLWKVPYTTEYDVTISDPVWHDGVLLVGDYWKGSKAIRLDERGRNPQVIWQGRRLSLLMSTPLCRAGYAYALDKKDGLKCIELKTGKILWEGQHVTPPERNPHASLVWAGERALILNARGELILAELSPEGCRQISKASVIDGTWAHPAYAGGCVFVRNDKEIACLPLK